MLRYELHEDDGILVVMPSGALEASDFERLARAVDPYIESNRKLRGLMICTETFPGWSDFRALISHFKFVRDHHRKIVRVAAVTDSGFLSIAPSVAGHFVDAEVKHFDFRAREAALAWLKEA
jgi:hypothetical protein